MEKASQIPAKPRKAKAVAKMVQISMPFADELARREA